MAFTSTNLKTGTGSTATLTSGGSANSLAAGSLIVVVVVDAVSSPTDTFSDSAGNTYTLATTAAVSGSLSLMVFYAKNTNAIVSGTTTFTLTKTDAVATASYHVVGFTGADTTAPLDTAVTAKQTGSSGSPSVTSGTPAVSGELFVAAGGDASSTLFTPDATHGWSTGGGFAGTVGGTTASQAGGFQTNAGTGTIIYSPTCPAVSEALMIVGFKPASGGGGGGGYNNGDFFNIANQGY